MGCCSFQNFLMSSDSLHVYDVSKLIFTSDKAGLVPLLEYINRFSPFHQRVTIMDKIMGNGAALLSVLANCQEVYSPLGSQLALSILDKYHISYHITNVVPYIRKTSGREMCPMEKLSLHKDPEEFRAAVTNIINTRDSKM